MATSSAQTAKYNAAYTQFIRNSVAMGSAVLILAHKAGWLALHGERIRRYNEAYTGYIRQMAEAGDIDGETLKAAHRFARNAVRAAIATHDLDCGRCDGSGYIRGFEHVENARCFDCN